MLLMLTSTDFHKDFSALKIAPHGIGVAGMRFSHELRDEAITALLLESSNPAFSWKAALNARLSFELERENDYSFLVTIRGDIMLWCTCVRCLDPVHFAISLDFTIRMLEMEHLGVDAEMALGWKSESSEIDLSNESEEDDEPLVGYYSRKAIDLGLIVRDQIFLRVPDYPHCDMGKDALQASRCKALSAEILESEKLRDNPFVKKFGTTK